MHRRIAKAGARQEKASPTLGEGRPTKGLDKVGGFWQKS